MVSHVPLPPGFVAEPPDDELPLVAPLTPVRVYFDFVSQLYVNHDPFVLKENVAVSVPSAPSAKTIRITLIATHPRSTIAKP